jgi:hypothetical protein
LPETILGVNEALSHEKVMRIRGVDVGDAVGITEDIHLFVEAGEAEGIFCLWKWTSNEYHPDDPDENKKDEES